VAKIAELHVLRSPQRRSRVTIQNQEMIVEKEMWTCVPYWITELSATRQWQYLSPLPRP